MSSLQARDELITVLCRKEMGVYTAIFSSTGDTAVRIEPLPPGHADLRSSCLVHMSSMHGDAAYHCSPTSTIYASWTERLCMRLLPRLRR